MLRNETKGSGLKDLLGQMMTDFSDMTADLSFVVLLIAFSLEVDAHSHIPLVYHKHSHTLSGNPF